MRRLVTLAVILILALIGATGFMPEGHSRVAHAAANTLLTPTQITPPVLRCTTISGTNKYICGLFLTYWEQNGALEQQGLPLTMQAYERNPADGKMYLTQYFERARFELHPENQPPYDVLLGLLGREQLQAKYPDGVPAGLMDSPLGTNCADFPETGKRVCGVFLDYWVAHGGLAQQGLPLTDLFMETNPTDGKTYPTQYFERARFEYHAENVGTRYEVLLGLLGREQVCVLYPACFAPDPPGPPDCPGC